MNYGYARVAEGEAVSDSLRERVTEEECVWVYDIRSKEYDRSNYQVLRSKLCSGDVLYVDSLDSLGHRFDDMAAEWRYLTKEVQADVVILDNTVQLDSRMFKSLGPNGERLEAQMLDLLVYMSGLLRRRQKESQREGIDAARKAGVKLGRPSLQWDEEVFNDTVQRWIAGKISGREASEILNCSRSSLYKYVRERNIVSPSKRNLNEE